MLIKNFIKIQFNYHIFFSFAEKAEKVDLKKLEENPDELWRLLEESDIEIDSEDDDNSLWADEEPSNQDENQENEDSSEDSSEDEWSGNDDIPLSNLFKWRRDSFASKSGPKYDDTIEGEVLTPWEYFSKYLNDKFFELCAQRTAQYYLQKNGKAVVVTEREIKKFFGMHANMGCIHFPNIHMYWNSKFKFSLIADVMPRDRFYFLRVNLHVIDNLGVPDQVKRDNKLWKVQPMIDLVRKRCLAIVRKDCSAFSIDEQMIPFLGRCPVRQYVKNKPRPVGLKNFVVTTSDGTILDFEIYQGLTTPLIKRELGLGPSVILRLSQTLPEGSYLFFDRYFSTSALMYELLKSKIYGTGTIMINRLKQCNFKKDSQMKRGESDEIVSSDGKVSLTKWKDNKSVVMISSAFGRNPEHVVKRWDKSKKERIEVPCPNVVKLYNERMGGVDIFDQMMEYYRTYFRTKKWTVKVILHLFDLAIVNSWMEYRRDCRNARVKALKLLDFRLNLGEYLTSGAIERIDEEEANTEDEEERIEAENQRKKRKMPATLPCSDKRYDRFDHWPIPEDLKNPLSCRMEKCESRSRVRCSKCNVYLCLSKQQNCFLKFHCDK